MGLFVMPLGPQRSCFESWLLLIKGNRFLNISLSICSSEKWAHMHSKVVRRERGNFSTDPTCCAWSTVSITPENTEACVDQDFSTFALRIFEGLVGWFLRVAQHLWPLPSLPPTSVLTTEISLDIAKCPQQAGNCLALLRITYLKKYLLDDYVFSTVFNCKLYI